MFLRFSFVEEFPGRAVFCEAFGLARIRVTFGHAPTRRGHIRRHGGHIADTWCRRGRTHRKHRTHSNKWGGHTGHIADTSGFRHTRGTRGHIPTSQAHARNVLCLCLHPICFLSQPDSFRFSAIPTWFEMALQGQETPLFEERPKTSSFKTWALHDDFLLEKSTFCNL